MGFIESVRGVFMYEYIYFIGKMTVSQDDHGVPSALPADMRGVPCHRRS